MDSTSSSSAFPAPDAWQSKFLIFKAANDNAAETTFIEHLKAHPLALKTLLNNKTVESNQEKCKWSLNLDQDHSQTIENIETALKAKKYVMLIPSSKDVGEISCVIGAFKFSVAGGPEIYADLLFTDLHCSTYNNSKKLGEFTITWEKA